MEGQSSRAAAPYGPADRDRAPRGRRAGAVAVVAVVAAEPHEPAFGLPVPEHGGPARTQVFFFL